MLPIVVIAAAFYGAFEFGQHKSRMALVPADLEVTGILYANEKNWGSVLLPLLATMRQGFSCTVCRT